MLYEQEKNSEDLDPVFVKCEYTKSFYEYTRNNILQNKNLTNSLALLRFKRDLAEEDYKGLSCFLYSVWRVRNKCEHNEVGGDPMDSFEAIFNKWYISLSNI